MKEFISDILGEQETILKDIPLFSGIFTQFPHKCLEIEWDVYVAMELTCNTLELKL